MTKVPLAANLIRFPAYFMCLKVGTRIDVALGPGYTRDWLPAYSFVLREKAMVLTGERTLSDTSGARQ